jgi:hypothetical protein
MKIKDVGVRLISPPRSPSQSIGHIWSGERDYQSRPYMLLEQASSVWIIGAHEVGRCTKDGARRHFEDAHRRVGRLGRDVALHLQAKRTRNNQGGGRCQNCVVGGTIRTAQLPDGHRGEAREHACNRQIGAAALVYSQLGRRGAQELQRFLGRGQNCLGRQVAEDEEARRERDAGEPHIGIFLREQNDRGMLQRMVLLHSRTQHKLLSDLDGGIYGTHGMVLPNFSTLKRVI